MEPKKLSDAMLKADGIAPGRATASDSAWFEKMLDEHLETEQPLSSSARQPSRSRWMHHSRFHYAAAAVIIIGVLTGIYQMTGSIDGAGVAWADVVEQFQSMSFYNAILYFKEDAASEPKQIELWVSSEHKARVRVGSQVLFADKGKIVAGYDFCNKRALDPVKYDETAEAILENLCQRQTLSLEHIVQMVGRGKLQEVTPRINSDAMISKDLVVFDLQSGISSEWMRIWALRESKLPVRLRMWDPRDGECMDVFVTYEKQQSAAFFDHQRYEEMLLEQSGAIGGVTNLAYAFLQDPGGQDYAPQDLFKKNGYHMPQVEEIGITEHGAVWVIAAKSKNRKPDGRLFWGFSIVSDDLGRTYRPAGSSHLTMDDVSSQIFVSEDYPFDKRTAKNITLTCNVEKLRRNEPTETIGTIELTEWQKNSPLPQKWITETETDILLQEAYCRIGKKMYDKAESIVQMIQASPEADNYYHALKKLELRKLLQQRQFPEAVKLAEAILPAELETFKQPITQPRAVMFDDYLRAYAAHGDIDKAAGLWKQLKETKPDLSKYSKGAQKHLMRNLEESFSLSHDPSIVTDLFEDYGLTLEQVNRIFGFDVSKSEHTKWHIPEEYRDPEITAWNQHLQELADHYKDHPLEPGDMAFRKRGQFRRISRFALPGLEDYRVSPVGGTLQDYMKYSNYPNRIGRFQCDVEFENVELQHEIVMHGEVSSEKQVDFVLSQYGLELVTGEDDCTVWTAEYDGRQLPDYQSIQPLAIRGSEKPGAEHIICSGGISLQMLLNTLREDLDAVIENGTGLEDNTILSRVALNFNGKNGAELAEQWFKDNFGITFRKETRKMPIWIVRKREKPDIADASPVQGYLTHDAMCEYYKANPLKPGQAAFHSGLNKGGLEISFLIPDHKFMTLGSTVRHFAQMYHRPPYGRFRFDKDVEDLFVQYDIVYRNDVSTQKIIELTLSKVGVEIVEIEDDCTVWIAEYDGQELKPWGQIKCPIPNKKTLLGQEPSRPGMLNGAIVCKINFLLNRLAADQDIVIENQTGIDADKDISGVIPNFKEKIGAELAEAWYQENFGITFRKETRKMPVWIVRQKP